jgi:hypothetical protein
LIFLIALISLVLVWFEQFIIDFQPPLGSSRVATIKRPLAAVRNVLVLTKT